MLPPDLTAKLNECANTNFVGSRAGWFFCQTVFSWIVIAGLVFEGPEVLHDISSVIAKWFPRTTKTFPRFDRFVASKRFSEFGKALAFIGWMFIVAGLGGELEASSKIVDLSRSIGECSEAKLTETRLVADDAVLEAYKTVSFLSDRRLNNPQRFVEALKGKPKVRVVLWYNPNDSEAWTFARQIYWWLGDGPSKGEGAGWNVSSPVPIPTNGAILSMREYPTAPIGMRFDGSGTRSGLTFIAKNLIRDETNRQTAIGSLMEVLSYSIYPLGTHSTSFSGAENPSLPDDLLIVVVGPKPTWYFGLDEQDKTLVHK